VIPRFIRRSVVAIAAATIAIPALIAAAQIAQAQEKTKIRAAYVPVATWLPLWVAKDKGVFDLPLSTDLYDEVKWGDAPQMTKSMSIALSDLGLRSYLAYWVSTIVRFLRYALNFPSLVVHLTLSIASNQSTSLYASARYTPNQDGRTPTRPLSRSRRRGYDSIPA